MFSVKLAFIGTFRVCVYLIILFQKSSSQHFQTFSHPIYIEYSPLFLPFHPRFCRFPRVRVVAVSSLPLTPRQQQQCSSTGDGRSRSIHICSHRTRRTRSPPLPLQHSEKRQRRHDGNSLSLYIYIYMWASALCICFYINPALLNGSTQFHYCTDSNPGTGADDAFVLKRGVA